MNKFLILILAAFLGACASSSPRSDLAAAPDHDVAQQSDDEDSAESNLYCERYKPIGSNMTQKRCYAKDQHDAQVRAEQDAERRRRGGG